MSVGIYACKGCCSGKLSRIWQLFVPHQNGIVFLLYFAKRKILKTILFWKSRRFTRVHLWWYNIIDNSGRFGFNNLTKPPPVDLPGASEKEWISARETRIEKYPSMVRNGPPLQLSIWKAWFSVSRVISTTSPNRPHFSSWERWRLVYCAC